MCCGSVQHIYSSSRASFTEELQELLEDSYADLDLLSNVGKTSYVVGTPLNKPVQKEK